MEKNNTLLTIMVLGLVLVSALIALNKNKTTEDQNVISVSGQAKVITEPDKAEVFIKIYTEGKTATEAKDENAEIADRVMKALEKYVSKDDIETSYYYLDLKQKWDQDKEEYIIVGYELRHVLKVTTKKIDEAGLLIDKAVDNGANGVDRVEFGLTNEKQKQVNAQALEKASKEAKQKAESIAQAMSVRLRKIHRITESNYYFTPFRFTPEAEMVKAVGAATQIAPGDIEVSASVTVEYLI